MLPPHIEALNLSPDALRARAFAERAHGAQRYGENPYVVHLDDVVCLLVECGRADLAVEGYLHDVAEDCPSFVAAMRREFPGAWPVVDACTGRGPNRKARNVSILRAIASKQDAQTVKAADRGANMRAAAQGVPDKLRMYRAEAVEFLRGIPLAPSSLRAIIEALVGVET